MPARTPFASRSTRCFPRSRIERRALALGVGLLAVTTRSPAETTPPANAPAPPVAPAPSDATPALPAVAPPEQKADSSPLRPTFAVSGFVQVDWIVHDQSSENEIDPSTAAPLNQDRILLRRGRVRVMSRYGAASGHLELEATTVDGLSVIPFEAALTGTYPTTVPELAFDRPDEVVRHERTTSPFAISGHFGLMPIPFGFDALEIATERPVLERARATQAFFGAARDFGVGFSAAYQFARLSAAVMNGQPLGTGNYSGRDLVRAKDLVGRAGVSLHVAGPVSFEGGLSFLTGTGLHPGVPPTKDSLTWVDSNENGQIELSELVSIPGSPGTPSKPFDHGAIGGDARLHVEVPVLGRFTLRGEMVVAHNLDRSVAPADPIAAGRTLREIGWQVGASQELTEHAEVAVRYDSYNPDADDRRQQGGVTVPENPTYSTWAFDAAGKLDHARLMVEYDHNDNALGRSPTGAPSRLRDDAFIVRGEYVF